MKKGLFTMIIIFTMFATLSAQIGVNTAKIMKFALLEVRSDTINIGGILLPKMTQAQRDSLPIKFATDWGDGTPAAGLQVFSLDGNCNEYWNGSTWISICSSTALANINLVYRSAPIELNNEFDYDGTDLNPNGHTGLPRKDLVVTTNGGAELCHDGYVFSIVSGSSYTNIINPTDFSFSLVMDQNPNALNRTAIIRVTDKCTSGSKDYIFTQVFGDICPADTLYPNLIKPVILANDNQSSPIDMCNLGSIQLFITAASYDTLDVDPSPTYIWTYNGSIVGGGESLTASQSGTYQVYVDAIGCTAPYASDPFVINATGNSTASTPLFLKATNNGVICNGSSVDVIASGNIGTDSIYWYRNGRYFHTTAPDMFIVNALIPGDYTATIGSSSCASAPSNTITIVEKVGTIISPFADANILVNGISIDNNPTFCSSGILDLRVSPPVAGVTYTWFINDQLIGTSTGNGLSYNLANLGRPFPSTISLTVVASKPGDESACDVSISSSATNVTQQNVDEPYITGDNYFCSNGSATLQASVDESGTTDYSAQSFRWINTTSIPRTYYPSATGWNSSSSLTVRTPGEYLLMVTTLPNGQGCSSQASNPFSVRLQGTAQLRAGAYPNQYNAGDSVIMNVFCETENDYPSGVYTWTSSNPSMVHITRQQDPKYALVVFDPALADDTVKISIHTDNDCGSSNTIVYNVTRASAVQDVNIIMNGANSGCGGVSFTIPNVSTFTSIDPTTKFSWDVISDDVVAPTRFISGAYNETCYIPYTKSNNYLQVRARATGSVIGNVGSSSTEYDAGNPVNAGGYMEAIGSPSAEDPGSIIPATVPLNTSTTGAYCYDVNPSQSETDNREPFDPTTKYQYRLSTSSTVTNLTWSLSARSTNGDMNVVTNFEPIAGTNNIDLSFDVSKANATLTPENPITVVLIAHFDDGGCSYQINSIIYLQDGPCCPDTTPSVGKVSYTVGSFGRAGCWMTENLNYDSRGTMGRSYALTTGGNFSEVYYEIGYADNGSTKMVYDKTKPNPGVVYSPAAYLKSSVNNVSPSDVLKVSSTTKGICPTGWVIPSAEDWRSLDAEMRANGSQYGDPRVHTTNYRNYYYLATGTPGNANYPDPRANDVPTGASATAKSTRRGFAAYMSTFVNTQAYKGNDGTGAGGAKSQFGNRDGAEGVAYFATSSAPSGASNGSIVSGVRLPAANSSESMQIREYPFPGAPYRTSYAVRCMKQGTNKRIQ